MLKRIFITIILHLLTFNLAMSQGPDLSYYLDGNTTLKWANAQISFRSGSSRKIPFFPLVDSRRSIYGTDNYTKDIKIERKLIFAPSVCNLKNISESNLNINDKFVLYCYDMESNTDTSYSIVQKIAEIIRNGAAGIILFSQEDEFPFIKISDKSLVNTTTPIISVSKSTANALLSSAGYDTAELWQNWEQGKAPNVKEPIYSFCLNIKGNFTIIESELCTVRFNNNIVDPVSMEDISKINDKALHFLHQLFKEINPKKQIEVITYFSDYDEKLFYTSHWGKGLADWNGIFSIVSEGASDYELAVHELTHRMFSQNWNGNSSFLSEGIAMYSQAKATNSYKNHTNTILYITNGTLLPIEKLAKLEIGKDRLYTAMGYSAAGSFVEYLIETEGIEEFLKLWKSNQNWENTYNKSLTDLEKEWHRWLFEKFTP